MNLWVLIEIIWVLIQNRHMNPASLVHMNLF